MDKVDILGIPFDVMTQAQTIQLLRGYLSGERHHVIVTPNPEAVMQARRNPAFKAALLSADLRLADGIGIVMAARMLGKPLPERVRGLDTAYALLESVCHEGRTAYFLGGAPGVAEAAKEAMEARFPGLRVIGCHDGYFNEEKERIMLTELRQLKPNILLLGLGMPKQELWAKKNRDLPIGVTLCIGGTLDVMSGRLKLTPAWMRRLGLEWLHRLLREPHRAKRMLDLPRFIGAVLVDCFKRK